MEERDITILKSIVEYCKQIDQAIERFGDSFVVFRDDTVYRNACSMCILQIGELTSNLSDKALSMSPMTPWRAFRDIRNMFAHAYSKTSIARTWKTMRDDIPSLRSECERILEIIDIKN